MAPTYHVGQRLSFNSHLCAIRYIGPVQGTQKDWLGVEWDDPLRGKHDGEYQGVRYFSCRSNSKTAASFVRPTRTSDPVQSLTEAVREKYASEIIDGRDALRTESQIEISGKLVEKVGFDKIRKQLAQLQDLKIVIVDGLRISYAEKAQGSIKETCPKIVELDLSRNLFESCEEIIKVCRELDSLKVLRLNGNRLSAIPEHFSSGQTHVALESIKDLSLDETLLTWEEVSLLVDAFPSLTTLSASSNDLSYLSMPTAVLNPTQPWGLTSLTLDYNSISTLTDAQPLEGLGSLERLYLKGNQITSTHREGQAKPKFGERLRHVDLSYNDIRNWSFVDDLPSIFPGMTSLRFSHNPIYEHPPNEGTTATSTEEGYMLTVARIAPLKALNFSNITPTERTNAEMFYLSRIAKAMATVPESDTHTITNQHRRYDELCQLYGLPTVARVSTTVHPDFLEARLIKFTFYLPPRSLPEQDSPITHIQEIPRGFDVYQVKGIAGRLFDLRPLSLRLVWETGEWDPVAGFEDLEDSEDEGDDEAEEDVEDEEEVGQRHLDGSEREDVASGDRTFSSEKGRWMRREVELENGTRQVGFWVDGLEARIRIELGGSSKK